MAARGRGRRSRTGSRQERAASATRHVVEAHSVRDPWVGAKEILKIFDASADAARLLRSITPEEVWTHLSGVDPQVQRNMLGAIGVHTTRPPVAAHAAQFLARLRSNPTASAEALGALDPATSRLMSAGLDPEVLAALLSRSPEELTHYAPGEEQAHTLEDLSAGAFAQDERFLQLALLGTILSGLPTATLALALLTTGNDPAAQAAWDSLMEQDAPLPPLPMRALSEVGMVVVEAAEVSARMHRNGTDPAAFDCEASLTTLGLRHLAGEDSTVDEDLLAVFDEAGDLLPALGDVMARGDLPPEQSVDRLEALFEVLHLAALPVLGTRAHLQGRVATASVAKAAAARHRADRVWLKTLTGLVGPEDFADEIAAVTGDARALLDGNEPFHDRGALETMHRYLTLTLEQRAGRAVDPTDLLTAAGATRNAWPEAPNLIDLASHGFLSFRGPDEQDEASQAVDGEIPQNTPAAAALLPSQSEPTAAEDEGDLSPGLSRALHTDRSESVGLIFSESTVGIGKDLNAHQSVDAIDVELATPEAGRDGASSETARDSVQTASEHVDGQFIGDARSDNSCQQESGVGLEEELADLLAAGFGRRLTVASSEDDSQSQTDPAEEPLSIPEVETVVEPITPVDDPLESVDARVNTSRELDPLAWGGDSLTDALADATATGRLGLAADLALSAGAPTASVRARRLATFGQHLRNPSGALAAAFSDDAALLRRDDLGDDRPGQLLAWAAAARIALLAPNAGPARVLTELGPCVADQPGLAVIGEALIEASRSGVVVLPENSAAVGRITAAEAARDRALTDINELLEIGRVRRRVLRFTPANGIYLSWLKEDGPLGKLLRTAGAGTIEDVPDLRVATIKLRGQGARDAEQRHRTARHSSRLYEPVLRDLSQYWDHALDLINAWCQATELASVSGERATTGSWQVNALATVRSKISPDVRDQARSDLTVDEDADPLLEATTEAVTAFLEDLFTICDGNPPVGPEPIPVLALHADLLALASADVPSDLDVTEHDALAAHLPALVQLAHEEELGTQEIYERLKAAGHHDQTHLLIELARTTDGSRAQVLERDRAADVNDRLAERADALSAVTRRLDTQRMSGGLSEEDWSALSARVEDLAGPDRRDFGRIRAAIGRTLAELDELQQQRVNETVERINASAANNSRIAVEAERLIRLAEAGNIASAEEYLEQLRTGVSLPDPNARSNEHLHRFYPAVPDAFTADRRLGDHVLAYLRSRRRANAVAPTALLPCVDLVGLDDGRVEEAKRALDGLRALRESATTNQRNFPQGALAHVLAQAGIDFANATAEPPIGRRRRWLTLTGVSVTGRALTPALGSGRSLQPSQLRILMVWGDQQPQSIAEWVRDQPAGQTILVLWLGGHPATSEQRRALAAAARGRSRPVVVLLDEAALVYLCAQPARSLTAFAAISLPFTADSPYRDTPGDTAPEMFYGRRRELEQVLDPLGPSFVSGGRQLGKSALLRTAQRRFLAEAPSNVAVMRNIYSIGQDGDSAALWSALWNELAAQGICTVGVPENDVYGALNQQVRAWVDENPARSLLILLDEADAFLEADAAAASFPAVDGCRRLMEETGRRVKVVFAGLHRTARFTTVENQPLSHFGQITVGPLSPTHAHELITTPLQSLGFVYQDPSTPARILALANNMPALLQLFGERLIRHLTGRPVEPGSPPHLITDEDIDTVWDDTDLQRQFREKYVLTLNLDHRYLVIAYTIAYEAHMNGPEQAMALRELNERARGVWPEGFATSRADDFRALVDECVDLGLLTRQGAAYRMRTPTVLRLLGTQDEVVDTLATASQRLTVPGQTVIGAYRRPMANPVGRCPMTERQLADVLGGLSMVTLVTGSLATGIDRVIPAVTQAAAAGDINALGRVVQPLEAPSERLLHEAVAGAAAKTVVMVDVRGAVSGALVSLASAATQAVAARPQVGVTFVADTSTILSWGVIPRRIPLALISSPGLRLLSEEEGLPFHNGEDVDRLHSATGGWPELVEHALAQRSQGAHPSAQDVLLAVGQHATARKAALSRSALDGEPLLTDLFDRIADLTGAHPEDRNTIVALLAEDDTLALPDMGSHRRGFLDGVVDALTDLGVLLVDENGAMCTEPVLTAARAGDRARA